MWTLDNRCSRSTAIETLDSLVSMQSSNKNEFSSVAAGVRGSTEVTCVPNRHQSHYSIFMPVRDMKPTQLVPYNPFHSLFQCLYSKSHTFVWRNFCILFTFSWYLKIAFFPDP